MPRERKALQQTTDERFRVICGGKYIYLGTKDRSRAVDIAEVIAKPLENEDSAEVIRRIDLLKSATDQKEWLHRWNELGNLDDPLWGLDVETDEDGNVTARYDDYGRLILDDVYRSPPFVDDTHEILRELKDQNRWTVIAKNAQSYLDALKYGDKQLFAEMVEYVLTLSGKPKDKRDRPAEQFLSDCLKAWKEWRKGKVTNNHFNAYAAIFERFIKVVGDLPINRLTKDIILKYERHLETEGKNKNAKWIKDQFLPLSGVFRICLRKTSWDLPSGILQWCAYTSDKKYAPDPQNRVPLPSAVFDKFLAKAKEWADIDLDEYAASLPVGNHPEKDRANNKKQAIRRKRAGIQWSAMLRLALNCGLDNVDLCNIKWENINRDGKLPYMQLARGKVKHQTGQPIMRWTPLLPSTLAALDAWREYNKDNLHKHVFTNDAKRPFESSKISEGFARLREGIENADEWNFKNIRNVGATIGKRQKRHPDEREAFLGHAVRNTSRYYEGDVDESYLLDLVNLIAAEYFAGEQIRLPKKKK